MLRSFFLTRSPSRSFPVSALPCVYASIAWLIQHWFFENRPQNQQCFQNAFLQEHFPRPDPSNGSDGGSGTAAGGKRTKQANISQYLEQPSELLSMSEILEELMNLSLGRPHDPYITITDRHWAPYLELLIRWVS
jgi:hypothetical protein